VKKIIPIIIILFLTLPLFAYFSQAQEEEAVEFVSCVTAGYISELISDGLNDLMDFIDDLLGGLLGDLFGLFGLGSSVVPVYDERFHETYTGKEFGEDLIARCAAREILIAMGRDITNVARTGGRNGGPAWVRNWRNFQLDAQYRGEDVFRGELSSTNLCDYYGDDLKGMFGATQETDLTHIRTRANDFDSFQVKAGCTLPDDFDFEAYKRDFSGNGGWEAWSRLLEPQNNFYGSLFLSLDEAEKQRAIEESADLYEAGPTGFTSIRGENLEDRCIIVSPYSGECLVYNDISTPGGIISGSVLGGIESELQWMVNTDELNEIIANGISVMLSRLWDLSDPDEGHYFVPEYPEVTPTPSPTATPPPGALESILTNPGPTDPRMYLAPIVYDKSLYGPTSVGTGAPRWHIAQWGIGGIDKSTNQQLPSTATDIGGGVWKVENEYAYVEYDPNGKFKLRQDSEALNTGCEFPGSEFDLLVEPQEYHAYPDYPEGFIPYSVRPAIGQMTSLKLRFKQRVLDAVHGGRCGEGKDLASSAFGLVLYSESSKESLFYQIVTYDSRGSRTINGEQHPESAVVTDSIDIVGGQFLTIGGPEISYDVEIVNRVKSHIQNFRNDKNPNNWHVTGAYWGTYTNGLGRITTEWNDLDLLFSAPSSPPSEGQCTDNTGRPNACSCENNGQCAGGLCASGVCTTGLSCNGVPTTLPGEEACTLSPFTCGYPPADTVCRAPLCASSDALPIYSRCVALTTVEDGSCATMGEIRQCTIAGKTVIEACYVTMADGQPKTLTCREIPSLPPPP